ncbi:MAG TPA: phosphoribosyltransferase [Patescibacteria group bacterium]|nr:phosphoribosyltransferase [Patescibacteria group bacterium]
MSKKDGEVFSVIEYYIKNHNPDYSCDQSLKNWIKCKEKITQKITIPDHTIIHDRNHKEICRPYRFSLTPLERSGENFRYYCRVLTIWIKEKIENTGAKPNILIAMGGANIFAKQLLLYLGQYGIFLEFGSIKMNRVVSGGEMTMEYDSNHYIPDFDPGKFNAFIIEDFLNTGLSVDTAIKRVRCDRTKVLGVIAFTNSYRKCWPFDVPINISFLELPFEKFPAGTCPEHCQKISG